MASKQSLTDTGSVPLEVFAREVEARRARLGAVLMPRNSGERRTASKRALLDAIKDSGGEW